MNINFPLVSIITISYNSEETIEKAINSVLNQTYKNIEYIIIDGKSKDKTLEIIQKYKSQISKIISEKDDGIYDAFNKGLDQCNGEYIQILNSDDYLEIYKIENCINYIIRNQNIDILVGDLIMIDNNNKVVERRIGTIPSYFTNFRMGNLLHPTFFVKTSIYKELKFNNYKIGMDFDWVLRSIKELCEYKKIDNNIVYMRNDGNSNQNYYKSMLDDKKISIDNGVNILLVNIYFCYSVFKKKVFIILSKFFPQKFLYYFKPGKVYID